MPALRNRLYRTRRRTSSSARTQGMAPGEGPRRIVGSATKRQQLTITYKGATPPRTTNQTAESSSELQEQICLRAHELFEHEGETMGTN
jgi:hypothetical protein